MARSAARRTSTAHSRRSDRSDHNGDDHDTHDSPPPPHRAEAPHEGSSHDERSVLEHGRSTAASDVGPVLTSKTGSIFGICADDGDIDSGLSRAHGLYFHDMRFLDRETLRLNGQRLSVLLGTDEQGDRTISELTNHAIPLDDDDGHVFRKETLGIRRERVLSDRVEETVQLHNFNDEAIDLSLELSFAAAFADMFVIRGADPGKRGTLHDPHWRGSTLRFRYDGADGRTRTTALTFDPRPAERDGGGVRFRTRLRPAHTWTLQIVTTLRDEGPGDLEQRPNARRHGSSTSGVRLDRVAIETNNPLFDRTLARSFGDLQMLMTHEHGDRYFAAGIPWYVALFGRDSLITSLQTLAYNPALAANTLRVLARYQGTKHDAYREEEPGKILHELRVGEKANLHEVPQYPYYGTVDATPLFIILAAEYVRWTGDLDLWHELRGNVERALYWIDRCGDHDGDGFVDYSSSSGRGLSNQGWKDSGNSITNRDGSLAVPPIALVEVQGYVYRARLDAAWLFELDGSDESRARARLLCAEAAALRARFHEAYWLPEEHFLAIAIEQGGRRAESIASNAGQALWGGIVAPEHAAGVAELLRSERMDGGWGVRTLAEGEAAYNPIDYQVGSVWPHDNSLIAAGLRRYGFVAEANRIFSGIFQAASYFPHYRLPEVFAGFSRAQYSTPVHYPVACRPQAWAAGAIPYFLQSALGLMPDAPRQRLRIERPALPDWLDEVTVRNLRVGAAGVDLRYRRGTEATLVAVAAKHGEIDVEIAY